MSCSVCSKNNACILCCDVKLCLLDFMSSMHSEHASNANIFDISIFNKDLVICKEIKAAVEGSISEDIANIEKKQSSANNAASRSIPSNTISWDMSIQTKEQSPSIIDMSKLPPPPSISRNEGDSFAAIMAKLFTRTLRYRFEYLPLTMKQSILNSYREDESESVEISDDLLFERRLSGIVMQLVSIILRRSEKGELWISKSDTEARRIEGGWSLDDRLKKYVRNLDSNLLTCDDTRIICDILMRIVDDITDVDLSQYFSHMKNMKIWDQVLEENRQIANVKCARCGNDQMLRFGIREFVATCTHDEIWRNKDSADYLIEYTCPKCTYTFRTESWIE